MQILANSKRGFLAVGADPPLTIHVAGNRTRRYNRPAFCIDKTSVKKELTGQTHVGTPQADRRCQAEATRTGVNAVRFDDGNRVQTRVAFSGRG